MTTKLALLPPCPEPTPEDVRAFYAWYCGRLRIRIVRKQNAPEMRVLAELLDRMGVLEKEAFIERFTTIVPPIRAVYVPFEPGVPTRYHPLWEQIAVLCHEGEHMRQCSADGDGAFSWDYVTSPARRAHYEALAYRVNLELRYRFFGEMKDPRMLASSLRHYGCSATDVDVAAKEMLLAAPVIQRGIIVQQSTRIACEWLDRRWPRRPAMPRPITPRKPPIGLPRLSTTTRTPVRTRLGKARAGRKSR